MEAKDWNQISRRIIAALIKQPKVGDGYSHRTFSDEYPWTKKPRAAQPITDEQKENWKLLREVKP